MKGFWLALVAAAAVLGAAEPARAQDRAPGAVTTSARVIDKFDLELTVDDPSFYRPASGFALGGSGKGSKVKELHVWKGAHEIIVPLEKIKQIEVHEAKDADLIGVRLTLAGGAGTLEGKIERDLELRGRVLYGAYQIRVERAKSITIRM